MPEDSMNDAPETAAAAANENTVDLSSLKDLSFGPAWTTGKPPQPSARFDRPRGEGRPPMHGNDRRADRRPPRREFSPTGAGPRRDSPERSGPPRGFAPRQGQGQAQGQGQGQGERRFGRSAYAAPVFQPTADVLFYPEDSAFRALTKAIRNACRTYELFEVAHLILEKPERFVAVIRPLAGSSAKFYQSVPDSLVFETEEAAINHVCQSHIERFFTVETVEVEAPKGSFAGVSKCTLSGEWIAPPNYHRYQELLRTHHAERYPQMPFERFVSHIELDKNPDSVNAWLAQMTKATRYTEKSAAEGVAPAAFDSLAAARAHLIGIVRDKLVKETNEARISGRAIETLPAGNLKRSVEHVLEQQRRFPLTTANNLRGRLRRMKFGLYKRGSKGISYVCAVKRRFRDENTVFAKNLQDLIVFIEKHPNIYAKDLPEKFLGIVPVVSAEPAPKVALQAETAAAEASEAEALPAAQEAPAAAVAQAPAAPAPLADPNAKQISALLKDLHWLVSEGYVTEYGDGRLFAPAPLPAAKAKQAEAAAAAEEAAGEASDSDTCDCGQADVCKAAPSVAETPAESTPVSETESLPETNTAAEAPSTESEKA